MDHIEAAFQKQQALWNAIINGRTPGVRAVEGIEPQIAEGGRIERPEATGAAAGAREEAAFSPAADAAWRQSLLETAAPQRGQSAGEAAETARSGGLLLEAAEQAAPEGTAIGEAAQAAGRRTEVSQENGTAALRVETEIAAQTAPGIATDARELSRRFERDARRYDGDYLFY